MSIELQPYTLPDASFLKAGIVENRVLVWQPAATSIVLGFSNSVEESIHAEAVTSAGVVVYRRPSGGQTVLLSTQMLVVSLLQYRAKWLPTTQLFRTYNRIIIKALGSLGVKGISEAGSSDITLNGKKICGSAIYQNKEYIFFHAVLNVGESAELIEKYIKHPPRQPDYRAGRSHRDFITSIWEQDFLVELPSIASVLERQFQTLLE